MVSSAVRNNIRREDSPAQTLGLQAAYRKELARRLRELRGVLRETIVDNDALGIKGGGEIRVQIDAREDFGFERTPVKQVAFRNQLQEWIDDGILEPIPLEEVEEGQHYTGILVRPGYAQGIEFANTLLVEKGEEVVVNEDRVIPANPIHVETLEDIYTRNYRALEDITEDIDRSVSKILVQALREGWGTRRTADRINSEVREIERTRARTLARTEIQVAHNRATLRRYEEMDVQEVEIITHTPCPICREIEANEPYPIAQAWGLVPAHPNCVCTYGPIV